mmetsp:Transcript_121208/g.338289  ORF Transcript_121208/g.338289 Transcript_121208/m.338289 type:complete len:132 (-) Transcript_121208:27-422(-)
MRLPRTVRAAGAYFPHLIAAVGFLRCAVGLVFAHAGTVGLTLSGLLQALAPLPSTMRAPARACVQEQGCLYCSQGGALWLLVWKQPVWDEFRAGGSTRFGLVAGLCSCSCFCRYFECRARVINGPIRVKHT